MTMDINEKIESGYYQTQLLYGKTTKEKIAYRADQQRLNAQFKADLLAEFNMTDHPKAEAAYNFAREHTGRAHNEMIDFFGDLVELLVK
jgi:hypothetical protein